MWRPRSKRSSVAGAVASTAALAAVALAAGAHAAAETPPFNLEVILRDIGDGKGFGQVTFRQRNDDSKVVLLDTWVRDLAPNHSYRLQRAVDQTLDGDCTSTAWLTLGSGLEAGKSRPTTAGRDERTCSEASPHYRPARNSTSISK